ncbi:class I poly(R)-hydroxyalkanoic acid synthase [Vibrio zhugei]|uniref:Class I poly(R)-hydroxyalkanoic acid synthase n=1 Tax=Vibrio zhugei TaxID=2479546 RepID=A0ABV7C9X8_9VIBR|nr:class I poly(R)-hydroxyalkanoic acid synthase [Vibrio zhugei]
MYQNFFSEYLVKVQEANAHWWKNWEANKQALNSPVNNALREINFDDTAKLLEQAANQPQAIVKLQSQWWEKQLEIWQNIFLDPSNTSCVEPEKGDKRFADEAWQSDVVSNFIKQSYILFSKTYLEAIESVEGLDEKAKERLMFFSRQTINALSPSNFIATNPELRQLTIDKNGANLMTGLEQLKEDVESSAEILKIRMTNQKAFRIGQDIATTPGDVVYRNDLFELIQYKPMTEQVNATPLLIVPPYINKYYILDLREKNSMVRWLVEQGHTVFMMSWRNPGVAQRDVEFGDYVTEGVTKAVSAIEDITGKEQINAIGYCIGGTILASTIAYYAAKRMKKRIKSATFLTTILDFQQPGDIGVYINKPIIDAVEIQNDLRGYMDGRLMNVTFSLLRENSLYWNYYVEHYLKGNDPVDFDLLYWNSDGTNLSAATSKFMLQELYLNNKLVQNKGVKIGGVWIDLKKINIPSYFISTKEDHIALWQGTYKGALHIGGQKTFVLGQSGHIAGIVNHPAKNKYGFWLNETLSDDPDTWLTEASHEDGSWWTHWNNWVAQYEAEEKVAPYPTGSEQYPSLMPAPGRYVKVTLPVETSEHAQ